MRLLILLSVIIFSCNNLILPILKTTLSTFLVEIQKVVFIFTKSGEAEKGPAEEQPFRNNLTR